MLVHNASRGTNGQLNMKNTIKGRYSETSIYRSRIYSFPGSIVQFLWSLNKSYLNYGINPHRSFFDLSFSRIYRSEFLVPMNVNPALIVFNPLKTEFLLNNI
jgi:hypothetical protein